MKKQTNKNTAAESKRTAKIKSMISEINSIMKDAEKHEKSHQKILDQVHPDNIISAKNLIHYRTLRLHDVSELQKKLGSLGLSRLEKPQASVMASLQTTKSILRTYLGKDPKTARTGLSFKKSNNIAKRNVKSLLGYRTKGRHARIMVTIPSEAAINYTLVEKMIANGMNCARINCAHDSAKEWAMMIKNIRKASKKLKKNCKIAMDLAGPKIRTGALVPGPKIKKFRPEKDLRGKIKRPLLIRISSSFDPNNPLAYLPVSDDDIKIIDAGDVLYFKDTRGKKRTLKIVEKKKSGILAKLTKTSYFETGMPLYFSEKKKDEHVVVGDFPPIEIPIILKTGDLLRIDKKPIIGEPAKFEKEEECNVMAHVSCTAPQIFDEVKIGEPILFDDGRISGRIKKVKKDYILVKIIRALDGGSKLRADKGINLPFSKLTISGLTEKDRKDLEFVVQHADIINMSFVNSVEDVKKLVNELKRQKADPELGVILKIETQNGFNQLTDILLEALQLKNIGVMIARGDLAIEVGWGNIGRVQQEILTLCESAHVTDVWATQVLENLAKRGLPSRAEITDVIKAQQADCVMLNKGPYILDSIKFLDQILKDMEPYREKSARLTPMMVVASPKGD